MKSPYEVLGLNNNASNDEIKISYKKQALKHHPDRKNGDETIFKELTEAYAILSDPDKKNNYDKFGNVDQNNIDISDIINNMFGFGDINIDDLLNDINNPQFSQTTHNVHHREIPVFIKVQRMNKVPSHNPHSPLDSLLGNIFDDILCDNMFQSPPNNIHLQQQQLPRHQQQQHPPRQQPVNKTNIKPKYDNINVDITIDEIIKSSKKKINYTIMDLCDICRDYMVKCLTCNGAGNGRSQNCYSCNGQGFIITKEDCIKCQNGLCKKDVELSISIPKGVPENHIFQLKNKGSYNMEIQNYNHLKLTMKYNLPKNIQIHGNSIFYYIDLKLEELLCGFSKKVKYGNFTDFDIKMDKYINPTEVLVYENVGIPTYKKEKELGDLIVKFNIIYPKETDNVIDKYQKVFKKIFNKN